MEVDVRLWGKSADQGLARPYPLICHLLDTAAVAGALLDLTVGPERTAQMARTAGLAGGDFRALVMYWSGLHDLGKVSPSFQGKVPELYAPIRNDPRYVSAPAVEAEFRFHHGEASQRILAHLFAEDGYAVPGVYSGLYADSMVPACAAHQVAQMLGGHHGRFHRALTVRDIEQPWSRERLAVLGSGEWTRQARAHAQALRALIGPAAGIVPAGRIPGQLLAVLTGLVVTADWLASQESYISAEGRLPESDWSGQPEELSTHWRAAVRDAIGVVRAAGLGRASFMPVPAGVEGFRRRFPRIVNPNPLQASLAEKLAEVARGVGLLLITAPPGDGKTEAAEFAAAHLAAVSGAGGLAFALPTMATTDAMFRRVRSFAADNVVQGSSLALVHGMAWLNTDFEQLSRDAAGGSAVLVGNEAGGFEPFATDWLRGRRRGLHASLGAMTIDQQLAGVLPLKHNMLRLFGLSGKVVVIDEAHSYGPYMHQLLVRLLEWLGAMRVPVVVMSATLAGSTARSVLEAYRRGCGHGALGAEGDSVPYPGWVFLDADSGRLADAVGVGTDRARALDIVTKQVTRPDERDNTVAPQRAPGDRLEVLGALLDPIRVDGGCVLVCCNTVAEAQETYEFLRARFPDEVTVELLHARFRSRDRARITGWCERAFGKPEADGGAAARPRRAILVATQIVEQSIDLDFDLVVSDLAPLALLFQRAGRCRRHERGARAAWTAGSADAAKLIVLDPVSADGGYEQPKQWGAVYFEALLRKTSNLLRELAEQPVAIPGDVQRLIDEVYAEIFTVKLRGASTAEAKAFAEAQTKQLAVQIAEAQAAKFVEIPPPAKVRDLSVLSGADSAGLLSDAHEATATTRLGADSARIVLAYVHADGSRSLDGAGLLSLPETTNSRKTLPIEQIRRIMQYVVPAPGYWLRPGERYGVAPMGWSDQSLLRDLVVVDGMATDGEGWRSISTSPALEYNDDMGLLRR
ncbi:CRISPR-associated endonuclease Cas3'' [Actinocrinis puniceicyclus]|uniref:CRISPR-associated endonuclease Cas3 n=1 Tax=Actinocrinis puniceicyclus TaxID=977794 RepID=A0A8J7WR13_9ACTN|nr:CRISPR-associated endonuclease Cas3'' [Actinocrinis puniceicyclus]MBS2963945.1 CRISPR-associated endonuclease Cas3'' [Actinocrinis puniceicyclus]